MYVIVITENNYEWRVPIPHKHAKYFGGWGRLRDHYTNSVPGGRMTVLAVDEGHSGVITWNVDLDTAGIDPSVQVMEVGV